MSIIVNDPLHEPASDYKLIRCSWPTHRLPTLPTIYCIILYFRRRKFVRKVNLKYFREKIFSRIYCSRDKYLPAKISSRENIFARRYFREYTVHVKISSCKFFPCRKYVGYSRPRLCGLGLLFHNLEDPIQLGFVQQ